MGELFEQETIFSVEVYQVYLPNKDNIPINTARIVFKDSSGNPFFSIEVSPGFKEMLGTVFEFLKSTILHEPLVKK